MLICLFCAGGGCAAAGLLRGGAAMCVLRVGRGHRPGRRVLRCAVSQARLARQHRPLCVHPGMLRYMYVLCVYNRFTCIQSLASKHSNLIKSLYSRHITPAFPFCEICFTLLIYRGPHKRPQGYFSISRSSTRPWPLRKVLHTLRPHPMLPSRGSVCCARNTLHCYVVL